jgi:hypothetical protein
MDQQKPTRISHLNQNRPEIKFKPEDFNPSHAVSYSIAIAELFERMQYAPRDS